MHPTRVSIAGVMGAVAILAISMTVLRSRWEPWAGTMLLATCGILSLAVVAVSCRDATERPWWLGFALFGWGYLALAFWSPFNMTTLPTITLLQAIFARVGGDVPDFPGVRRAGFGFGGVTDLPFTQIAHCIWALVAAIIGGAMANWLCSIRTPRSDTTSTGTQEGEASPRLWWRRPAMIGESGLAVTATIAVVTSELPSMVWAGLTFLATIMLLGCAILGALLDCGRSREIWIGAAVFGWGYLILAFGLDPFQQRYPYLVTGQFLSAVGPWFSSKVSGFPACDDRTNPENRRILKLLERPIPLHYPAGIELDPLVKVIKNATTGPDGKGIPIHINRIGMQEEEKSLTSTIVIDLDGIPLKLSLQNCLRQLGLNYFIKDGYMTIVSEEDSQLLLYSEKPFLTVGHSLLALIAAIFGGAAAPVIAGRRERT